jgi:hypothetical protein
LLPKTRILETPSNVRPEAPLSEMARHLTKRRHTQPLQISRIELTGVTIGPSGLLLNTSCRFCISFEARKTDQILAGGTSNGLKWFAL